MDFQFSQYTNQVVAKCSMEQIALANWFNIELKLNSQLIYTALSLVQQGKSSVLQELRLIGKEYSLFIHQQEVVIKSNSLEQYSDNQDEWEQDWQYYDQESIAILGLEDFENFLNSYLAFTNK